MPIIKVSSEEEEEVVGQVHPEVEEVIRSGRKCIAIYLPICEAEVITHTRKRDGRKYTITHFAKGYSGPYMEDGTPVKHNGKGVRLTASLNVYHLLPEK